MDQREFEAWLEVLDGYWPHERTPEETMALAKDLGDWPVIDALDAIDLLHDRPDQLFRPRYGQILEARRLVRQDPVRQATALPAPACDCDGGFRWVDARIEAVIPCRRCMAEQHQRWSVGAYRPRLSTPWPEQTAHDLANGKAQFAKLREQLAERR
ncbi:MAG: hypothetical protein AB7G37_03360 [Solirubrobacteraceae bacterium]